MKEVAIESPVIYKGDNLEFMSWYPDGFFDLIIDDAPYGIGEDGKRSASRSGYRVQKNGSKLFVNADKYHVKDWDNKPPDQKYFDELFRVSKHQIIWGENHFDFKQKSGSSGRIVWDKVNSANDFSDCEIAWTSLFKSVRQIEFMWNGMMQGKSLSEGRTQQGNKKLNEKRIHVTQKPVLLYVWLLKFAKHGWRIGDFHLGSGSHRIACDMLGFDLWACEADDDHYRDQDQRFNEYLYSKPKLYSPT